MLQLQWIEGVRLISPMFSLLCPFTAFPSNRAWDVHDEKNKSMRFRSMRVDTLT